MVRWARNIPSYKKRKCFAVLTINRLLKTVRFQRPDIEREIGMNKKTAVTKISGLLETHRSVVGIKLVRSQTEYRMYEAIELARPLRYCVAVKSAMAGHSIKLSRQTGGCVGSNRALGLMDPPHRFFNGTNGREMGLYADEATAASVATSVPICSPDTFGVVIKPLELFEVDPDVVLIVAFPRTMMRILQGYTYHFGLAEGMHMSGNQAVCVECTVTPMQTGSMNISMLCSGTRHSARWQDTECMAGISFGKFYGTVKGIENTVNAVEPDDRKRTIEGALGPSKNLEIEIEYGKTYYKKKK
jgi:uncharacterized protein (DUF169 family)